MGWDADDFFHSKTRRPPLQPAAHAARSLCVSSRRPECVERQSVRFWRFEEATQAEWIARHFRLMKSDRTGLSYFGIFVTIKRV
eukprot:scaffold1709_cov158-Ochromonas_danica.AAC.10